MENEEMPQDVKEYDRVKAALEAGDEEVIPGEAPSMSYLPLQEI